MTILDQKNPHFFTSIPTADGRFMVASMLAKPHRIVRHKERGSFVVVL